MMNTPKLSHRWDVTPQEARFIQKSLVSARILTDDLGPVRFIAGVDVSFESFRTFRPKAEKGQTLFATVVVLEYPGLHLVHHHSVAVETTFPYVPGLLSFREVPPLLEAFAALPFTPDLVMCDGHGISHPVGLGLATHLGLALDLPTIGCAKSLLIGSPRGVLAEEKGAMVDLLFHEAVVGKVVRTRTAVKPLYVSTGHRVGLESAVYWVMNSLSRYRMPEPTRQAHRYANQARVRQRTLLQ
jgi:deoxyribonuclease V